MEMNIYKKWNGNQLMVFSLQDTNKLQTGFVFLHLGVILREVSIIIESVKGSINALKCLPNAKL